MKKIFKRIISIVMTIVVVASIGVTTYANNDSTTKMYEQVLNNINTEYGLNLVFKGVNADNISLDEYEEQLRALASEQRDLLDYIESKDIPSGRNNALESKSYVTKTRTKAVWGTYSQYYRITATYNVINGSQISLCWNAYLSSNGWDAIDGVYLSDVTGPTYSVIDGARTSTVSFHATVNYGILYSVGDVLLYTEFYYYEA